jgi:protein gp37
MKLGDLQTVALDDTQVKALVTEWLGGDNPTHMPWGEGFMSLSKVYDIYFKPWLVSAKKKIDDSGLAKTMLIYRFGHALEAFPHLVERNARGDVSFNTSAQFVEKWITEANNVPWNFGAHHAGEIGAHFLKWLDQTSPKDGAFLRGAYDTPVKLASYFKFGVEQSNHVSIGKNRRRSYTVIQRDDRLWEFYSAHGNVDGRTLVQHWMYSRRNEDVPWGDEISPTQMKTAFDAFCTRYFAEEFGSDYQSEYISRESLEEYFFEYARAAANLDTFKVVRYKKGPHDQKFKFYHPERHLLQEKYDLENPHPHGERVFRAIMLELRERPNCVWGLWLKLDKNPDFKVSYFEVQYARLKLLDGGYLSNTGRHQGLPLWSVVKPYRQIALEAAPRREPTRPTIVATGLVPAVIKPKEVGVNLPSKPIPVPPEPARAVEPLPEPKVETPAVTTSPKDPEPIQADISRIMSISEIARLFKVARHHVQRVIDKHELKQHTKTRFHVPLHLIQEYEKKVVRTLVPSHSIGQKYDAARRTIAADIARAFNKLGTIPSYNDYLAWDERSLEFANKDAFNHYFSDWDAALIVAGILRAPVKPALVKTKPERPTISIAASKPEADSAPEPTPDPHFWDEVELRSQQIKPKTLAELKAEYPTIDPALITRMHELSELGRETVPVTRRFSEKWELDRVSKQLAELDDEDEDGETGSVEAKVVLEPIPATPGPLPVVIEQPKRITTSGDWFDDTTPFEPIETDTNTFDFLSETIQWNPVDSFTKAVDFEVLRLPNTWEDRQIVKVGDFAGINLLMLGQVLGVMIANPRHLFLIETRDVGYFNNLNEMISWEPNIFLGVKTEFLIDHGPNLQEQLHALEHSQAKIRFIHSNLDSHGMLNLDLTHVDWVIAGAPYEHHDTSEHNLITLAERCAKRGKAFYFKGWYGPHTLAGKLYREVPA